MGNCLKMNSPDDISLLRGSDSIISTQDNGPMPIYQQEPVPQMFYQTVSGNTSGNAAAAATHMSEEDQIKIAKRIGLVQHLPIGTYDSSSKKAARECVICMVEFCHEEAVRYLPCMHIYHVNCIDDWLMRSLTCPSCLEPVDAALLTSYETT